MDQREKRGTLGHMLDHLGVHVRDIESSRVFYDRVLAPIGIKATAVMGGCVGYGYDRPFFWLEPAEGLYATIGGAHIAFVAYKRGQVLAAKAAAEMLGAKVVHQPQVFGEYHPSYFAVFVLDPSGCVQPGHPRAPVLGRNFRPGGSQTHAMSP